MLFSRTSLLVRSKLLAKNQRKINKMAACSGNCCTTSARYSAGVAYTGKQVFT